MVEGFIASGLFTDELPGGLSLLDLTLLVSGVLSNSFIGHGDFSDITVSGINDSSLYVQATLMPRYPMQYVTVDLSLPEKKDASVDYLELLVDEDPVPWPDLDLDEGE
jgi:hypothetical protein